MYNVYVGYMTADIFLRKLYVLKIPCHYYETTFQPNQ